MDQRRTTIWIAVAWLVTFAARAGGQSVERLPSVDLTIRGNVSATPASAATLAPPTFPPPPSQMYPAQSLPWSAASNDSSFYPPLTTHHSPLVTDHAPLATDHAAFLADSQPATPIPRISDIKSGVVQRLSFSGAWMPAPQDGDLGTSDLETYGVFGFPCPTTESPLLVTPTFAVRYLDGPLTPDLPAKLYDASLQFRWFKKLPFAPWIMADLAIEPGVHGDFERSDADAFRLPGHGLAILEWGPRSKVVLGVLYLDREDVNILPAGGLIFTPNDDWQLDLVFPKPKIARRFYVGVDPTMSATAGQVEWWNYIAAEFGGGPYSIRRTSGEQDVVIWRDYRLFYGLERKQLGGLNTKLEVGYVLGRTFEYINSATPDFNADPTLLLRAGISY